MEKIYYILLSVLLFSFAFGYFINKFVLKRSLKYDLRKSNITAERWENQSKPVFGGISFYVIFVVILLYYLFSYGLGGFVNHNILAFVLVITLSFFMGLADDILNTSPYFKFIVQFINATILIYFGIYIQIFNSVFLNYILTYLWVVGIMNSINMLDNMDAITSLITITILIAALVVIVLNGSSLTIFSVYIIVAILGVLLCFLIFFNWNPSVMYMGDNGSQFIGALLSIIGIMYFWNSSEKFSGFLAVKPVIVTVLIFLVPIVDTTTVTINRLLKKQSPFVGGKDHTTHYLSYAGLSDKKVVSLLTLLSVVSISVSIYFLHFVKDLTFLKAILYSSFAIIVFVILYSITKITKPE